MPFHQKTNLHAFFQVPASTHLAPFDSYRGVRILDPYDLKEKFHGWGALRVGLDSLESWLKANYEGGFERHPFKATLSRNKKRAYCLLFNCEVCNKRRRDKGEAEKVVTVKFKADRGRKTLVAVQRHVAKEHGVKAAGEGEDADSDCLRDVRHRRFPHAHHTLPCSPSRCDRRR